MHYKNPRSLFKIKLCELFFNPWMHTSLNCDSTSHVLENNNIALHPLNAHFPHLHFHSVYHKGFQCCQKYLGPVRCYKINLKPHFKPSVLHTCCRVKPGLCSVHFAWTDVPGQLGEEFPSCSAHASTDHRFTGATDNTDIHQTHWFNLILTTFFFFFKHASKS